MKINNRFTMAVVVVAVLFFAASVLAAGSEHKHGKHQAAQTGMDHSGHAGEMIHQSMVDGYHFAYHLIDVGKHMSGMQGKSHITHHMMVYVTDPDGQALDAGRVGYLIQGPEDSRQQVMCMAMGGGFGADVSFKQTGHYTVKTKVMAGEVKLFDQFEYDVK